MKIRDEVSIEMVGNSLCTRLDYVLLPAAQHRLQHQVANGERTPVSAVISTKTGGCAASLADCSSGLQALQTHRD